MIPRPTRRWLRFSVGGLLLVVTALVVLHRVELGSCEGGMGGWDAQRTLLCCRRRGAVVWRSGAAAALHINNFRRGAPAHLAQVASGIFIIGLNQDVAGKCGDPVGGHRSASHLVVAG